MSRSQRKSKALKQLNLDAAGLDIGATEIWVCVPDECAEEEPAESSRLRSPPHRFVDTLVLSSRGESA